MLADRPTRVRRLLRPRWLLRPERGKIDPTKGLTKMRRLPSILVAATSLALAGCGNGSSGGDDDNDDTGADRIADHDEAIHTAAEWARDYLGLEFKRLRRGGVIRKELSGILAMK